MLSPFLVSPLKTHSPSSCSLTNPLLLPCPGILLHWDIKPSQDQDPLLSLKSHKAIFCYICGWSQGSLHVYSLVGDLVPGSYGSTGYFILLFLPMGLQTPTAPWVPSLALLLRTLCSVQWMAVSIHFWICQALAEPLRGQLYQAPVSKHLLTFTILPGFWNCLWNESSGRTVSGFFPASGYCK